MYIYTFIHIYTYKLMKKHKYIYTRICIIFTYITSNTNTRKHMFI